MSKFLVAVNGSPTREKALEAAVNLAESSNARLFGIGVLDDFSSPQAASPTGANGPQARNRLDELLQSAANVANSRGLSLTPILREGHAATNIRCPERKEGDGLIPMRQFRRELEITLEQLQMEPQFARRYVHVGFSGGETKRAEILQLAALRPKFAILDETDSGLDADAVRLASRSIAEIGGHQMGVVIITHHTGGPELAADLHKHGYDQLRALEAL
jgi:ABC-type dipeptide/oligopeptide/nickel transport system ATPase subunit